MNFEIHGLADVQDCENRQVSGEMVLFRIQRLPSFHAPTRYRGEGITPIP